MGAIIISLVIRRLALSMSPKGILGCRSAGKGRTIANQLNRGAEGLSCAVRVQFVGILELGFMPYFVRGSAVQFCAVVFVLASNTPSCRSAAQALERTSNGAIVHYSTGVVRVEVCSDRVFHIVSSVALVSAKSSVPVVIRPCAGTMFTTSSDNSGVHIRTGKLRIDVAADTGVARFSTLDGRTILNEEPRNRRIVGRADEKGPLSGVEQKFCSRPAKRFTDWDSTRKEFWICGMCRFDFCKPTPISRFHF